MKQKVIIKDTDILTIGGVKIKRGERVKIQLDYAALYDYTKLTIPVEVIRGKEKGPVLFISAAIHGDELNGIEIIRTLSKKKFLKRLKGTLILVPIVNVFGFHNQSRYLPDRRDLNRSFPGSKSGSLASRLAYIFMKEIVSKCTHGIDLHTGAIHRTNLPQIRACLDDLKTKELAEGFGAPVVINSNLRDGSLREAARRKKVSMLLFEGGEDPVPEYFSEYALNNILSDIKESLFKFGVTFESWVSQKEVASRKKIEAVIEILKSKEVGSNSKIRVIKPMIADGIRIDQPIFLYLLGNR
jgi:predicted deacylase